MSAQSNPTPGGPKYQINSIPVSKGKSSQAKQPTALVSLPKTNNVEYKIPRLNPVPVDDSGRKRKKPLLNAPDRLDPPEEGPLAPGLHDYNGFVTGDDDVQGIPIMDPSNSSTVLVWEESGAQVREKSTDPCVKLVEPKLSRKKPTTSFQYFPILYRGNPDDGTLFVYTGDKAENILKNTYIRLRDLILQIGGKPGTALQMDWDACFSNNGSHLPVWDRYGKLVPSVKFLRELFKVGDKGNKGQPVDLQDAFRRYCSVAYYAVVQPRDPFSVKAHFWDRETNYPIVYQVLPLDTDVQDILEDLLKKMLADKDMKLKFRPKKWRFLTDKADAKFLKCVGCHPQGYYEIYVTSKELDQMKGLQSASLGFPKTQASIEAVNALIYTDIKPLKGSKTESDITKRTVDTASDNNKRYKMQAQVMNFVSATTVAGKVWAMKEQKGIAEWLHRSAYSFGGLSRNGVNLGVDSSQDMKNLIFGTYEANTLMIRFEDQIKWTARTYPSARIKLETTFEYPPSWPANKKWAWITPKLKYRATTAIANQGTVVCDTTFDPFARTIPTRFDVELDERFNDAWEATKWTTVKVKKKVTNKTQPSPGAKRGAK